MGTLFERISDFLSWLGGADKAVLKKVPQARLGSLKWVAC